MLNINLESLVRKIQVLLVKCDSTIGVLSRTELLGRRVPSWSVMMNLEISPFWTLLHRYILSFRFVELV